MTFPANFCPEHALQCIIRYFFPTTPQKPHPYRWWNPPKSNLESNAVSYNPSIRIFHPNNIFSHLQLYSILSRTNFSLARFRITKRSYSTK